ncbi:MAG: carboxypeptidase-like regulatory domain-containing protein, partial [Planctomycetota bacterium]
MRAPRPLPAALAGLALVAAIALAWTLLRRAPPSPAGTPTGARPETGAPAPPVLAARRPAPAPEATPAPGEGRVAGLVVDDDRRPAVGVVVETRAWVGEGAAGEVRATTTTDARGRFRLEGLPEHGILEVRARPGPPLAGTAVSARPGDDGVVLCVLRGTPLRLRVVDETGRGVPASVAGET